MSVGSEIKHNWPKLPRYHFIANHAVFFQPYLSSIINRHKHDLKGFCQADKV